MRISGELGVMIGALIIWLQAVNSLLEAVLEGVRGNWPAALWNSLLFLSYLLVGKRVWDAA